MRNHRPFLVHYEPVIPIDAERKAAAFASWYELFPRSQSGDPHRHGTFNDVVARLPAIRAMGFDVLYFPPIHPIGHANRKGRNNSLTAAQDDPGSPYAIGGAEGGHDAIHPELGTLEDFRRLITAAEAHGIELALDFAIQCSPDHPWLRDHRDWFAWRPDGSVKYAENPPKTYEDIVNVDFYARWRHPRTLAGFAQRRAVLGRPGRPHIPRRQSAHQAAALLGVDDRRYPRPSSGHDLPGRGLHPSEDDVPIGEDRVLPVLHLLYLAQLCRPRCRNT